MGPEWYVPFNVGDNTAASSREYHHPAATLAVRSPCSEDSSEDQVVVLAFAPGFVGLAVAIAIPAMAQVTGRIGQESKSDDVALDFSVSNEDDYASQCTPATQFGNTGNFQNGSSFVQGSGSDLDDFEPGGIEVSFGGSQGVDCSNTIQQSSAASS